jgi:predicted O-methyltransferase YrrM
MIKSQIEVNQELYNYIIENTLKEREELNIITTEQSSVDDKILQITPHQGQFLAWLIRLIRPKKTLDLGTYKGYSALCVALASPADCKTVTIDCNEEYSNIAKNYWVKAGVVEKIEFRQGNAIDCLDDLINDDQNSTFDFIFIDADKANYIEYYERSLALLKTNGIIAIDNTLYFGTVINTQIDDEEIKRWVFKEGIQAIKSLNKIINSDCRVESCLLPIADGLTLLRKV